MNKTGSVLREMLDKYENLRRQITEECADLGPDILEEKTSERKRTFRLMLARESSHEMAHVCQMRNNREAMGRFPYNELELLLMRAAEVRGHVLSVLVGLSDDEIEAHPVAGEWSIKEVLQHLIEREDGRVKELKWLKEQRDAKKASS